MPNRLAQETSPYLLQHRDNPVDWFPWGEVALSTAAATDKPLLISVGYSACHWCHVMEHESFEDPITAQAMNESFVCVKVDREERPDIDAIYMDFVQGLTGHGGWPMTVFATPSGEPFYGGTYYPPEAKHGLPSFRMVLAAMTDAWNERRDEVLEQAARLTEHLRHAGDTAGGDLGDIEGVIRSALEAAHSAFDPTWGGIGAAPKFPQPMLLDFLLAEGVRGEADAIHMVDLTLDSMAARGMFDQLGGGFARYSVDRSWTVPHFEKMLYDNAQLLRTYARAWLALRKPRHAEVARATAEWMLGEMRDPGGGFWSSLDADSEGEEGRYYVWTLEQVRDATGDLAENAVSAWGFSPEGNFEGRSIPVWTGREGDAVEEVRTRLLRARAQRVPPATDDKVLLGWNALAAAALAEAGSILGEPAWTEGAVACMGFMRKEMRVDGRFRRAYRSEEVGRHLAVAEDYAFYLDACITLYEATFEPGWITEALEVAAESEDLFWDAANGGFFTTGRDAEELIVRPKDLFDNAIPSANSAFAYALTRLGLLTTDEHWIDLAEKTMALSAEIVSRAPLGFGLLLSALGMHAAPAKEIAIVGNQAQMLIDAARSTFIPYRVIAASSEDDGAAEPGSLKGKKPLADGPAAYVCERGICSLPVGSPEELLELVRT